MREICEKCSWPQSGVILLQATRLSWRNSPDPKGPKGKGKPSRCLATHTYLLCQPPACSTPLHQSLGWALGGWSLWPMLRPRLQKSHGGCRSGIFSFCRGKGTQNPGRSLHIRPLGLWLLITTRAMAINTCLSVLDFLL